jgi:hypothetical protein
MYLKIIFFAILLFGPSSSSQAIPPGILKKDVKRVCKCYKEFVELESKDFPKSSPYYQQARAEATTSLLEVEKHIQADLYSKEDFSKWMKKKCPELIKKIQEIN